MGKKAGWISLCLIMTQMSFSYAQGSSHFGVKAGLNIATFHRGMDHFQRPPKVGYHTGVYYRRHVGDLLTLRPEIYYSVEGAVFRSTSRGQLNYADVQSITTLHRLNVPVLIEIGKKLTLDLGGQLGLQLAANNNVTDPPTWFSSELHQDLDDSLAWGDFSVVGGLGFHPGRHFEAAIRYNYGLTRTFEASAFPTIPARKSNYCSGVFQATVGYSF